MSAWYFLTPIFGESFGPRALPGLAVATGGIVLVNRTADAARPPSEG